MSHLDHLTDDDWNDVQLRVMALEDQVQNLHTRVTALSDLHVALSQSVTTISKTLFKALES